MILKRITIQNIRSYVDSTSIDLPKGTILFQGDVGCGKSSILLSIEFALFGLGDLDGRHLLRNGKSKGSVELEFEANGGSYTIFRSLIKKSKNVVQGEGYLIEDGEKTDYSVGELKARILEIINIKERIQPKTTSIIYRFAIFTPQEMMKQILTENQDRRLEILRRAFGIEEYNTVKKNITEIGIPWLKAETRTAKELSKDLLEKQTTLDSQKKRTKQISEEIKKTSDLVIDLDGQIKKFDQNLDKLHQKKEKVVRLEESIPLLKKKILTEQRRTSDAKLDLEQLEDDLGRIKVAETNVDILKPKYEDYLKKKTLFAGLEESVKLFSKLEKEKIKLENIIERDKQHLHNKIRILQDEIQENKKEIQEKMDSINILEELKKKKELLEAQVKPLSQFRKQFQDLSNKITKQDTTKSSLVKELEKKSTEIDQINEIGEGAQCPKCKQKLTKEHIITVTSDFEAEKIEVNQEIKKLEDVLRLLIAERKKIDAKIGNLENSDKNLLQIGNKIAELEERKKSISNLTMKFQAKKDLLAEQTKKFNDSEYSQIERKNLIELEQRMNELSEDVESYNSLKQLVDQYEYEEIELKYLENVQEAKQKSKVEKDVQKISKSIKDLESAILLDMKQLEKKQSLLERSRQVVPMISTIESKKKEVGKKCIECKTQIASKRAELAAINIHDLESEVSKKEQYFSNMIVYGQANNWMNECFIPIVEDIEQNVLSSINEEFNIMFQHWFNLLVDMGEITVEVDENFTPLITQGGYTLDVLSLSGGEKTSVALAYRLALNGMIKKTASFKSNLLILDEPTDGFSSEQLIRLRYVLDEMDSSQIIMVSHEKELESFVSTIYRITKQNGISRVEVVT